MGLSNRISYYYLIEMKRPQSAKSGQKGYWGQLATEEVPDSSIKKDPKKAIRLMRPDLTTHDFSRILPRKIHQDKERLYSEALQLKQTLNEVAEENVRLKTKISILEKERDKMNRYMDSTPDALGNRGGNSRLQLFASKSNEKQNAAMRNLKKMVRTAREQNQFLKVQAQKIKKTIKYTSINELQIEKKMLMDENKRLSELLQEASGQVQSQQDLQRENEELKKYLQEEIEQNKRLSEENEKFSEIIDELESKIKSETEKYQAREKKLMRDLALEKRRTNEQQRCVEDLRKEIKSLQNSQSQLMLGNKKTGKTFVRPVSSVPQHRIQQVSSLPTDTFQGSLKTTSKEEIKETQEAKEIYHKNQQLEKELKEIKSKLQQSESELQKRATIQSAFKKDEIAVLPKEVVEVKNIAKPITPKRQQVQKKEKVQKMVKVPTVQKEEEQSYQQSGFQQQGDSYAEQFQKSSPKQSKREVKKQESQQIQKLKKDFEQNEQEEQLYKKQGSGKKQKKGKSDKKEKKKKEGGKQSAYKPNKKVLAEIKELLTYRMKSQRYPFADLKNDIEAAETSNFTYVDLCNMLVNQPFFLTSDYTKSFLCYCYQKQKVNEQECLQNAVLVAKLRKVIQDFPLLQENQEKEMIMRIAEMTSSYPQQLQAAFDNIKNGEETVSRKDLIEMFEKLQLEHKYIELIIAELSLCSDDLEHLNFVGYFERFYIEEDGYQDDVNAIQEQGEESEEESCRRSSRAKKGKITLKNQDSEDKIPHLPLAPERPVDKQIPVFEDDDILSDDGRI